jgi:ElaB/YqjD/DUF883 family membrane-anchored ribosome-binding protein
MADRTCYACGDAADLLFRAGRWVCRDLAACSTRLNARLHPAPAPVAQEPDARHESLYDPYSESEALSYMRAELREAATTIARLTAENERLTSTVENLLANATPLSRDHADAEVIIRQHEATITALRARVAELDGRVAGLNGYTRHKAVCADKWGGACDCGLERLRAQEGRS